MSVRHRMRYPDLETKYELHETLGSGMMGTCMTCITIWHNATEKNILKHVVICCTMSSNTL